MKMKQSNMIFDDAILARNHINKIWDNPFKWWNSDEINNIRYPCSILWYALAVNCGGKVSICNFDWNYSGVVGDIHSQTIKEIWNGPRQKEIRKMHLNKVWNNPEVCEECVGWVSSGDNTNLFHEKKEFL